MTVIVEFRQARARPAERSPKSLPAGAEIVIFPGIRVEHHGARGQGGGRGVAAGRSGAQTRKLAPEPTDE